ncbi:replication protein [Paracoccus sp. S4493]|nr:replication protein [Paracoccus sp. S4493]
MPQKPPHGSWVQTERAAHEAWAALITRSPVAARAMHVLTSRVGEHNAVILSQEALSNLVGCSERRLRDAVKLLAAENWIEIRRIGGRGTVNAYVINDRVAWAGARDGRRYSLFSATVIAVDDEQPDANELGQQAPLRQLPTMYPGEGQLPSGEGLDPPSQPSLGGLETDLPARRISPPAGSPFDDEK